MENSATHKTWLKWRSLAIMVILLAAIVTGFALRLSGLGQIGLAEDEVNKIVAVREYQQGVFTGNGEHPMLMKLLIYISVTAVDAWNSLVINHLPGAGEIAEEVAVRFPNVLFGALTAIPLFLVGRMFFSKRVGILAAWFWAIGIHAVFLNRIAKEDTLLVFFLLLGIYCHGRMKTCPDSNAHNKRVWYLLSATSFGLLLASKYFPHFWGLILLYFYLHRKVNPGQYPSDAYNRKDFFGYLAVLAMVFLLANPIVLHAQIIKHIVSYTGHATVTHHGYYLMGQLYPNSVIAVPLGGTPWFFYLLALGVKFPLPILGACLIGLLACVRQWREKGPFFVLFWLIVWLVPYSVVGVKFLRYSLSLTPVIYLLAASGVCKISDWLESWVYHPLLVTTWRRLVGLLTPIVILLASIYAIINTFPFFAMYVNEWGGGRQKCAYYFPHDECYDLKLREAIDQTLRTAPAGSVMAGESPAVFRYYLARYGRKDITVINLSDSRCSLPDNATVYVFLQPGRVYYENTIFYQLLWNREPAVLSESAWGHPIVRVFRLNASDFLRLMSIRQLPCSNFAAPQPISLSMQGDN